MGIDARHPIWNHIPYNALLPSRLHSFVASIVKLAKELREKATAPQLLPRLLPMSIRSPILLRIVMVITVVVLVPHRCHIHLFVICSLLLQWPSSLYVTHSLA